MQRSKNAVRGKRSGFKIDKLKHEHEQCNWCERPLFNPQAEKVKDTKGVEYTLLDYNIRRHCLTK